MNSTGTFSIFGILGLIGTSFFSIWAVFKYIVLGTYRLNGDTSKRFMDRINRDAKWTWVLSKEHVTEPKYPEVYEAFAILGWTPFYFSRIERMLTAGWQGKEGVCSITFLRWHRRKIEALLRDEGGTNVINISALSPNGQDRLGELIADPDAEVYLNPESYLDIEDEVKKVLSGEMPKTGFLLYGAPGNGKTQFVKYLSKKYSLPINVVYLSPDYTNYDIARMFSEVPRRCIVLLEDFDNYFNGRNCSIKNDKINFTFDSLINAFDGVHNDYRGVIFAMTVNDITKVDDAFKSRPSRFKFVREFGAPNSDVRLKILKDPKLVKNTQGKSLDQVFSEKMSITTCMPTYIKNKRTKTVKKINKPSNICPGCCYSDGRENGEDGSWICHRCGDEGENE